ncbi:hypothetical protein OTK49_20985 [Vibrio coralliirubri]|uniref:hypothetical protein n=1 Tax=Vibrio coralliirubri TaxID=1516159 RepID=UPI002283BA28|nr:hypothetical protein [Vibrio coralliirubri]MCY9864995.1 hypothetical protein [Vibrio coralliirubri]
MNANPTSFKLIDTNSSQHEITILAQDTNLRLVFPYLVNPDNNQAPTQVVSFDKPDGFNNLFGFITDRMHRMKAHNPTFDSIQLGERTHKLNPNYKADKKLRDAVFIDGTELRENYTVSFTINDELDKPVTETKLSFYELMDMANGSTEVSPFLSGSVIKAGKLPKEVDVNGYPMLTKNLRTNRILYENTFFLNDFKEIVIPLNNELNKVLEIAEKAKEQGYQLISTKLFNNEFRYCSAEQLALQNRALLDHNNAGRTITVESLLKQMTSEQPKKQQLKQKPVLIVFKQNEEHVHSWETDAKKSMSIDQLMEAALSTGLVDTFMPLDYTVYEDNGSDVEHILSKGSIQPSLMK